MNDDQSKLGQPKLEQSKLGQNVDRREALRLLGCMACATVVPAVLSSCGLNTFIKGGTTGGGTGGATGGAALASSSELSASGQFKLTNIAGAPAVIYASPTQVPGSVQRGAVFLVAFSRACTHKGTVIDAPVGGVMNCSNHGQDFDAGTGKPSGTAAKTSVGLTQFKLEVRSDGTVWAV